MIDDKNSEAFVYLWFDAKNRKFYVGKHLGKPTDWYAHSSVRMEKFTMKTKPSYMRRRILAFGTHDEVVALEHSILERRKHLFGTKYYNGSVSFPTALPGVEHHAYKHGKMMITTPPEEKKAFKKAYLAKWYQENKEHKDKKTNQWFAEHPEYRAKYYQKNKEKIDRYRKKYYDEIYGPRAKAERLRNRQKPGFIDGRGRPRKAAKKEKNKTTTLEHLFG